MKSDAEERGDAKFMAVLDVVKWDGAPNVFAYRYPNCELTIKSQVVVYESQEAVFVKDGCFFEPLGPGRHVLDTQNHPFVTRLMKDMVTGHDSPFVAEVWFVNKALLLDVKWGTADPIQIEDPKYHIMMPVRAYGQYGLQVSDTPRFLSELVGRVPVFVAKTLSEYFKGIVTTKVKDCIATYLLKNGVSILHISSRLEEISAFLQEEIGGAVQEYGVKLVAFNVNSITTDESDPAVSQVKRALAKKAEMDIVGYTYEQEKSFDVMSRAAANQGGGAAVMQSAMGLGLGMGMAAPMGNAMGNMTQNIMFESKHKNICATCGVDMPDNANFCPKCGAKKGLLLQCESCKSGLPVGSRFCPFCGKAVQ